LNVHGIKDVRQKETPAAEPLIPEPRPTKIEIAIEMFNRYKSPGTGQIPTRMIQAEGSQIPKLINCVCK
jgi:hypothetical protein